MLFIQDSSFYKKLVVIALPIALQSLVSSSLTLLDNLMVSRLGELSLTAVGLAAQVFSIEWMIVFGFCTGCSTFYTQFWGIRDTKSIKNVIGFALSVCVSIGILFFLAGTFFSQEIMSLFTNDVDAIDLGAVYLRTAAINFVFVSITQPFVAALRSTQQTKVPMIISIVSFISDAIFNYLLIFGSFGFPKLGVAGAAVATVIARSIEIALTLYVIFVRKNIISGKFREFFGFNHNFAKRVVANAGITTLNETMWILATAAQNAAYGHLGVTAYASVQASATIMDLFQMACFSIGDASLIMIGEQLGRNNIDEAKKVGGQLYETGFLMGTVMAVLLIIFNRPLISLFGLSAEGIYFAKHLLIIRAIFLPLNLQNGLLVSGTFRAGGDTKFAAICEISTMWLFAVPAAFVFSLVLNLRVDVVFLIVQFENIIKFFILLKRYKSGKWLKNMIKGMNDELQSC